MKKPKSSTRSLPPGGQCHQLKESNVGTGLLDGPVILSIRQNHIAVRQSNHTDMFHPNEISFGNSGNHSDFRWTVLNSVNVTIPSGFGK